jgi:hypothetical protein
MPAQTQIVRYFSKRQLANRYNVCPRSIERWVQNKKFPPGVQLPNGHWAWPDVVVEEHERNFAAGRQLPKSANAPELTTAA